MAPKALPPDKRRQLSEKFRALDKSGDGRLDVAELVSLLKKGRPDITDKDVKVLFDRIDKDHDGTVDFEEFIDFIYSESHCEPVDDGTEGQSDWESVRETYQSYCSKDQLLVGSKFAKLCKDCDLYGGKFNTTEGDMLFKKYCPRGKNKMDFEGFKSMIRCASQKRGCSTGDLMDRITMGTGPVLKGTVADTVRFHDDKSTYTGAQGARSGQGDNKAGLLAAMEEDQAKKQAPHKAASPRPRDDEAEPWNKATYRVDKSEEEEWHGVEEVYGAYIGKNAELDGREWMKICQDCKLFDKHFPQTSADLLFSSVVTKGTRHINCTQFKTLLRKVAEKKECPVYLVQRAVAKSTGPSLKATKAEDVRFHDDKSSYTGTHATDGRH